MLCHFGQIPIKKITSQSPAEILTRAKPWSGPNNFRPPPPPPPTHERRTHERRTQSILKPNFERLLQPYLPQPPPPTPTHATMDPSSFAIRCPACGSAHPNPALCETYRYCQNCSSVMREASSIDMKKIPKPAGRLLVIAASYGHPDDASKVRRRSGRFVCRK